MTDSIQKDIIKNHIIQRNNKSNLSNQLIILRLAIPIKRVHSRSKIVNEKFIVTVENYPGTIK